MLRDRKHLNKIMTVIMIIVLFSMIVFLFVQQPY
jgi:hypothetical protein